METLITTVETSVKQADLEKDHQEKQNTSDRPFTALEGKRKPPEGAMLKKELVHLKELLREKDLQIERLVQENRFIYAELERLHNRIEEECKRSDNLIQQMQSAAEASNKQANAIIMHLSQQIDRQREQITALQNLQGWKGVFRQLKSKTSFLEAGSIKRAVQPLFGRKARPADD